MTSRAAPCVLTFGETMGLAVTPIGVPLAVATGAQLRTAGAESTVAIGLARLGIPVAWAGVVGADALGDRVLRDLGAEGVDLRWAHTDPTAATGFMLRERRTAEHTRVTYYRSDSAGSRLMPEDVDAAIEAARPTLVHLTGITPALSEQAADATIHAVRTAKAVAAQVSVDVNYRATLPGRDRAAGVLRTLIPDVDVLFVGDDELHTVCDAADPERAAALLTEQGPGEVIVKLGANGALASAASRLFHESARHVAVVDAIGAGDSFVAGYLAAYCLGQDVPTRLRWGATCAAFTVGSPGDWEGLPHRRELERFSVRADAMR